LFSHFYNNLVLPSIETAKAGLQYKKRQLTLSTAAINKVNRLADVAATGLT